MSVPTLTINAVSRTSFFIRQSLSIKDELNARNLCSFDLIDPAGSYRPSIGQAVTITQDATTIFGGTIDRLEEYQPEGTSALAYSVECVDYNQLADRFMVVKEYTSQTAGAIIADIVTDHLAAEGVTSTNVDAGPTIDNIVFNYDTAAQAFDKLAELSGYSWWIDYNKNLYFKSRDSIAAPISLTDSSGNFRKLRVTRHREDYRNRQFIKAGRDITGSRTDQFKGDGQLQAFVLKFPVARVPAVTIDGSSQTLGIRGVDSGKQWYWFGDDPVITQDDGGTVLTSTQTLAVTYQGFFPVLIRADDEGQQTARAAVEGGTGIYEHVREEKDLQDQDAAEQRAQGILRKYGRIPVILEFESDVDGLASGQLLPVNITAHNLSSDFLIESVTTFDPGMRNKIRYRVRALSGESLGGWVRFFKELARQARGFIVSDNEVLIRIQVLTDGVTLADTLTTSSAAPESRVGFALVGYAETV